MAIRRSFSLAMITMGLVSCQSALQPTGFLGSDDGKMSRNKELPFSRSWKNPKARMNEYSRIAVRPMQVDGLRKLGILSRANVRNFGDGHTRDAAALAMEGTAQLGEELGRSPNRRVVVTTKKERSRDLMVLETNLAEVEPGRPSAQILNFFIPFASLVNRPSIGLEGRLVDARSGETLFAFSDLERPEISPLDFRKFTYYGVHRRELKRWAEQLRQVVEGNGDSLVRDPFLIQPVNW